MDITIFDEVLNLLMGTRPETFESVYMFLVYYTEVIIRIGLFGFVMRFFMNLVALPFRGGGFRLWS